MDASNIFHGNTKKYDIPIDHLDFKYIKECSDIKYLERIFKTLRSREEGFYEQLEQCCEERLMELNPNSRVLRKDTPLFSRKDLEKSEKEELDEDLTSWSSNMKTMEGDLGGLVGELGTDEPDLPPVRSGNIALTADGAKSTKPQTNPSKKAMPREYRDWDKIDIDKELEKVDDSEENGKSRTFVANREVTKLPEQIDAKGLTDGEKLLKANREKDKGNEAFKSSDFKEAITYYSRSISLLPTAASYNNRALAYLKTSDWQKAISDANTVLKLEPDNVKALLRRGTAYKGLKQLEKARADINLVLVKEPNNKRAQELLDQIERNKQEKKKIGRRMVIEDVEGEDTAENLAKGDNPAVHSMGDNFTSVASKGSNSDIKVQGDISFSENQDKSNQKPARRMEIEEIDSASDEDSSDNETESTVVVNGHVSAQEMNKNLTNGNEPHESDHEKLEKSELEQSREMSDKEIENVLSDADEDNTTKETYSDSESKHDLSEDNPDMAVEECKDKNVEETEDNNDVESKDERSSPVEAVEARSDSETFGDDESSDVESSGTEAIEVAQEVKRPVFYMKELPATIAVVKEEATNLFKSGQYGEASQKYSKVITMLEKDKDQIVNLSLMYSNRAACHLKTGELPGAVKDCNSSLQLIPHSVKPLLRRGLAYEHLERYRPAYIDYRHVLLLDSRMDQAHLGTKRCQQMLAQNDGPRWRDKFHLPKVSPFHIPEIIGLDGKSTAPVVFMNSLPVVQSQSPCPSSSQLKESISENKPSPSKKIEPVPKKVVPKVEKVVPSEPKQSKLTPQEQFNAFKLEGNECVKQSKFRDAIDCYNLCEGVLAGQVVIYTNRALCYIRTNQAGKAETDCGKALSIEKDNVKALFRRAQARKMLKHYREGIEDLKHLLKVDPKNTAANKEMELMKNYWREELESLKKNLSELKGKKDHVSAEMSAKSGSHSSTQSSKTRKRMVIQEVESDEEKGASKSSLKHKTSAKDPKPKIQVVNTEANKQKADTNSVQASKDSKPVSSQTESSKKDSKTSRKKSAIKETSPGLPNVPKTAPTLDKATPYEFISAWNGLKKSETVKPYYDLLKQIKPADINTVISNKLDGAMLNIITRCVSEHYIPNGESEMGYEILKNLSAVPRFGTVSMFMSKKENSAIQSLMNKLESVPSESYSPADIKKLRKDYSKCVK